MSSVIWFGSVAKVTTVQPPWKTASEKKVHGLSFWIRPPSDTAAAEPAKPNVDEARVTIITPVVATSVRRRRGLDVDPDEKGRRAPSSGMSQAGPDSIRGRPGPAAPLL
jgi:hypothetical protein